MRSLLALWVLLVALSSLEPGVQDVGPDYCCSAGVGEELWMMHGIDWGDLEGEGE